MKPDCKFAIAVLVCLTLAVRSVAGKIEKIIIDTDAGGDDAVGILLALEAEARYPNPGFKVIAITCTYGNTYEENVEKNVLKILTIANRSDIPVYGGASKSLLTDYTSENFFGHDGFGDFNFTEKIIARVDESKHAAVALIDLAKQYPGEITLISLGPVTNAATAIALEPYFLKYLKKHVIMGSSVAGVGNAQPNIEFNFNQDPESNFIVLNATATRPNIVFPWETAVASSISKDWRVDVLGKKSSRIVHYMNLIERVYLTKATAWDVVDAMTIAITIWPSLVRETILTNMTPVTDGTARGTVLVDYTNLTGKKKNAVIVQKIDTEQLKQRMLECFS